MRTGIFGGTFNPPHAGHLIVAEHVRQELGMDRIIFVPAAIPPHKQTLEIVEGSHRLAMVQRAVEGNACFAVSDLEIRRRGVSFTVDTLEEFKRQAPRDELFLLIGMDNLLEFQSWKDPEKIAQLATIVGLTRPGFTVGEAAVVRNLILCEVPEIAIASSTIRQRIKDGKSIRYLVPPSVEHYINEHRLYL
jgi:nicotinate-nucleotide adenylyltransferase